MSWHGKDDASCGVKVCTRLVVEGKAPFGRPRKSWQNTLSEDMRLLKADPRDIHDQNNRTPPYSVIS